MWKQQANEVSESGETIHSILSMDNTLFKTVEANYSDEEICPASPNAYKNQKVHRRLEKRPANHGNKADYQSTDILNIETRDTDDLIVNIDMSDCDGEWQDNTLFNEVVTQLNTDDYNDNDNGNDNHNDEDDLQLFNQMDFMNDVVDFEECEMLEIDYSHTMKECLSQSEKGPNDNNNVKPNKKSCSHVPDTNCTNSSTANAFYGLSDNVKAMILKVKGIENLYKWQEECLSLEAVKNRKNLVYALPTSGGKTLVAEILMLKELLYYKRNVVFILPFVAIVQEKVQSMAPFALELGFIIEEYAGSKGGYPPRKRRRKNCIYICTIEKALSLVNSLIETKRLPEVGMIVVDELHLLGESGGRGASLEGLLTKVLYVNASIHIIGMSATIGNLSEIAKFLNAELYTGNFRPVEIKEYVKCKDNIWFLDMKSEDLLTDLKKMNNPYSDASARVDPDKIGILVSDIIPNDSCLIFCSNRKNCENIALMLSNVLSKSLADHKKVEKQNLLNALRTEEGLCPTLSKTIKFGVAYHHSGLTSEERRLLEDAFRGGVVCIICCTSTLAAGVNLPARRVILRSPYVGNQFITLGKYKQMIGRAGRAGLGTIGESIIICKENELPKVKELLRSKMTDSLSTLHIEKDRGINNLILSAILLSIAATRMDIHKISKRTLLAIQQCHLNVDLKKVVDDALTTFVKSGVMQVKKTKENIGSKPNTTVTFPSQEANVNQTFNAPIGKKRVALTHSTELELCSLGRAALKGSIDMQSAYILYNDLKQAQRHLILLDHLHLLYLVTPYHVVNQVKLIGSIYYDVVINFSETQMVTARLLGINEGTINKLRCGIMPKNIEERIIQRFYITLILHDLWNHYTVYYVAEKYQISRGIVQSILTSVSTFASSVVRFCEELDEFWAFRDILREFSKKLSYCCPNELEMLMELPLVKLGRAHQLYKNGYTTIQSVAKANPIDLEEKIPYLGRRAVMHIIQAAKLKIMEMFENLQDDAENVLDGIVIKGT